MQNIQNKITKSLGFTKALGFLCFLLTLFITVNAYTPLSSAPLSSAPPSGTIIILNGISSSGKTTMIEELMTHTSMQEQLKELSMQVFIKKSAHEFSQNAPKVFEELWLVFQRFMFMHLSEYDTCDAGKSVYDKYQKEIAKTADNIKKEIKQTFDYANKLLLEKAIETSKSGKHVIFDTNISYPELFEIFINKLKGHPVLFVKIDCPFEVALKRQRERKNRPLDLVQKTFKKTHTYKNSNKIYDLTINNITPKDRTDGIKKILDFIVTQTGGTAVEKNWQLCANSPPAHNTTIDQ